MKVIIILKMKQRIRSMNYFQYSTKVWLTSLVLSPTLFMLMEEGVSVFYEPSGGLSFVLLAIIFGAMFSFPNWLLLTAGTWLVNRLDWSEQARRLLLQLWATVLTFGLFAGISGPEGVFYAEMLNDPLPLFYWLTITFGVWVYDFPVRSE